MSEVKRAEAQQLYTFLRDFAFEQSPDLRLNEDTGFEVQKKFYHADPVPLELREDLCPEMCASIFTFAAFRTGKLRNKRSFNFELSASIERTLPELDVRRFALISPAVIAEYNGFTELDEGALTEASKIEFSIEGHEQREIDVTHTYDIGYGGETIYKFTNENVLRGVPGDAYPVPPIESMDNAPSLFVPEAISHEAIEGVENIIINLGFWALVEPFGVAFDHGTTYQSASLQMRAIVRTLHTGKINA